MTPDEEAALKADMAEDARRCRAAAAEITADEKFKVAMADYLARGMALFQPFLVAAATAGGGPAAGLVAGVVGSRITAALQEQAAKET